MANTTLNYEFRAALHLFREGARLPVCVSYLLHANERGRAWPSLETLMRETGYGRAAVVEAKKWLEAVRFLEDVPYDKRMGEEENRLHQRLDVKQITGRMVVGDKVFALLYFNSSQNEPLDQFNSSEIERSIREPEVVTDTTQSEVSKQTPAGANDGPRPKKSRLDANGIPINNQHPRWEGLWNAMVALARTIGENVDDPSVKGQISNVVAKLIAKPDLVMPADVARFHAWAVSQGWGMYTLGAVPKWIHRAANGKSEPAAKYHKKANLEDA